MSDAGNYLLSWDQHETNRTSTLKTLWENEDFLDVTIACDDDQIGAHQVIMSAASPFFQKILKRNPHSHPLIYLPGTVKKDVQSLLDFIYSGETQVLKAELEDFMALANSLEVKGLMADELESGVEKPKDKSVRKKNRTNQKSNVNLETTDDNGIIEFDIVDSVGEHKLADHNSSNTSMTELEEKVSELITKKENAWGCRDCSYTSKIRSHIKEHVETHIEGYSHECKSCDKTFKTRKGLRNHAYICSHNRLDKKSPKIPAGTDRNLVKQEIPLDEPEVSLEVDDSVISANETANTQNNSMQDYEKQLFYDKKAEFVAKSEHFKNHPKNLKSWYVCGNEEDLLPSENLPEGWGVKTTVTQAGRKYCEYVTPDRVFKLRSLVSVIEYLKYCGLSQAEIQILESKLKQN